MNFQVLTLFPQMIEAFSREGVIHQAQSKGLISISCLNPRSFATDTHKSVDDRPYGGGDGMVLMPEPLQKALGQTPSSAWVVYLSPQGATLNQAKAQELAQKRDLVLICGRYAGVDQRFLNQFVDEELSIGDYVLSGGELAACVLMDSVARQVPGVLGHQDSASWDSFSEKLEGFLEAPNFTKPREFQGESVPEILLTGHHAKIQKWRRQVSILTTLLKRPDLVISARLEAKELRELQSFWQTLSFEQRQVLGLAALDDKDLELLIDEPINFEL